MHSFKSDEFKIRVLTKDDAEENKDELQLLHFPKIKITFDELFDEID